MESSKTIIGCRSCGSSNLETFLDLGNMPLADRLLDSDTDISGEPVFPLKVAFCPACSLVQITETVNPEILFADHYPYYSSFSPALLEHSKKNVLARLDECNLGPDSLVIELASNDGYLLKNYVEAGIPVLGIDPADGPASEAEKIGVKTLNEFFTTELSQTLADQGKKADIIHANNVLAHVADTNGFVAGIKKILKSDGVLVVEVPYLRTLIEKVEFDTIYHEHLCYFSATALANLFKNHGLYLNHVEPLSIHGGSLRLFVEPVDNPRDSVLSMLAKERDLGMDKAEYFRSFSDRVNALRSDLVKLIESLSKEGKTIAAYGAAAKGATLTNYCGLDSRAISFVVDRNVHKQGKLMPGGAIPILPPEALKQRQPDYALLLAWNFADEIMSQQKSFRDAGGKFIIPVPAPVVI